MQLTSDLLIAPGFAGRSRLTRLQLSSGVRRTAEFFGHEVFCRRLTGEIMLIPTAPALSRSQMTRSKNSTGFQEHGVGYQFESGEVIRVDSQFVHAEVVRPALALLSASAFAGAEKEFLNAHEHYRHGRYEEAIAEALKAFESAMKSICTKRKWSFNTTDTAKQLLDACIREGLVPASLQSEFSALRSVLESGVPTIRNKQAGHGAGPVPRTIPAHLAAYALHLTAASIVFLIAAERALP